MNRILGLDIGTASIGWTVLDDSGKSGTIIVSGVRIFPEGVDRDQQGGEQSKTQTRRESRGARRQIARRARRKRFLIRYLQSVGLLPTDGTELEEVIEMNPYPLRARALDEQLSAYEIGRVLIHLNQRRGFLSNRKTDKAKPSETKGMLAEISALAGRIDGTGCQTLGEYLHKIGTGEIESSGDEPKGIRNRHTRRDMYEHEFETIFDRQRAHHPELLSDDVHDRIHRRIFFQRKMYWPKSVIGVCDLERRLKRCPVADRDAQRFRIVQEVNNLKIVDRSTGEERRLSPEERIITIDYLSKAKTRSFDQIRKKLKFTEEVRFNFEKDDGGGRDKLQGHVTDATLSGKNVLGKGYWDIDDRIKDRIVKILIEEDREDVAISALINKCGLDHEQAECASGAHLPDSYANHSKYVIKKLLPYLEEGKFYMGNDASDSALHAAGYLRPDEQVIDQQTLLPESPDLPNPIVRQALVEVRKTVNAIIREHCKDRTQKNERPFDRIHVELARETKNSFEKRKEIRFENVKRRKLRESAGDEIAGAGDKVTRSKINKYLLWQEQNRTCVYSGKAISFEQMLSDATDVDHILPRWRSLDDSMGNKVVVFRNENAAKGDKTPYEWLADSDPEKYDEACFRAWKLGNHKYRRFKQQELELDQFVARQLVDTQYISRCVTQYLKCLGAKMVMPRGSMTAELRRRWELNNILSDDGEKTRADHRHHAVDAITIALITQARIQRFAKSRGDGQLCPWPDLRQQAEQSVMDIKISHRVLRRLSGALHEDTFYGPTQKYKGTDPERCLPPGSIGHGINRMHAKDWTEDSGTFVRRKVIAEVKNAKHLAKVRDKGIREILANHLRGIDVDPFGKAAYPKGCFEGDNAPTMPSGVPIKRVRLLENKSTLRQVSDRRDFHYTQPGNNHHITYRETADKKGKPTWVGEVTTMWDAAVRGRTKINGKSLPLVDQSDTETGKFVMSLSIGELFEIDDPKGELGRILCVVRKIDQTGRLHYKLHIDARTSGELSPLNLYVSPKQMHENKTRKVTVTPVGQIRWAND